MFSLKVYRAGRPPFNGREKKVTIIEFQNSKTRLWCPQHFFFYKGSVFRFTYWQEEAGYLWDTQGLSVLRAGICPVQTPLLEANLLWPLIGKHSWLNIGLLTQNQFTLRLANYLWLGCLTQKFSMGPWDSQLGYLKLRNWTSELDWYGS